MSVHAVARRRCIRPRARRSVRASGRHPPPREASCGERVVPRGRPDPIDAREKGNDMTADLLDRVTPRDAGKMEFDAIVAGLFEDKTQMARRPDGPSCITTC